jgi:hypothetical protein
MTTAPCGAVGVLVASTGVGGLAAADVDSDGTTGSGGTAMRMSVGFFLVGMTISLGFGLWGMGLCFVDGFMGTSR